jgi:hypothetical protein
MVQPTATTAAANVPLLDLGEGADLLRLTPSTRDALQKVLYDPTRPAATVLELLRRPARVAAALASLSGEVAYTLAALAFVGRAHASRLQEHLDLKIGAEPGSRAVDQLVRQGWVQLSTSEPRHAWVPPTLQLALRPHLASVLAFEGKSPSFSEAEVTVPSRLFEDQVLLAAVGGVLPKLTQSGELFKRDLVALHPPLKARFPELLLLTEEIDLLSDLGLLAVGSRIEVLEEPARAFAQLERGEQLRRHLLARSRSVPTLGPLWQLLLLGGPTPLLTLVELAELDASAEPSLWRRGRERPLDGPTRIDLMLLQPGVGVLDVGPTRVVGLSPTLRQAMLGEAVPAPEGEGRIVILPSLEAIVPPECPLPQLVALGRFMELEALDTVARFKVTREACERAARAGMTVDQMLATLEATSAHAVPDNLARAVRDFATLKPARVRFIESPVVVALDEPVKALLREDVELKGALVEVVPGVFAVPSPEQAVAARKRLGLLGLLDPREDEPGSPGKLSVWDAAEAEKRLLRMRQGRFLEPSPLPVRARAAVALASLGPPTAGSMERVVRARNALETNPDLWARFLTLLTQVEEDAVKAGLAKILDPGLPFEAQLDRVDRLVPEWVDKAKSRKRPKTRA